MGFFDNFLDENASAGSTSSTATAPVAVAPAPAKPQLPKDESADFLIIDDSVTSASMPSTASDIFAPASTETPVITFDEAPVEDKKEDSLIPEISAVGDELAAMTETFLEATPVEAPADEVVEEVVSETVLDTTETTEEVPASEVSEEVAEIVESPVDEVIAETPTISFGISSVSAPETTSVVEEEAPVTSGLSFGFGMSEIKEEVVATTAPTSDAAVEQAITKITDSISSKETARDAKLAENEKILAQIADLKKQAKAAQEEAREIDKSADRDRKLVEGLKNLIAA